MILSLTVWQPHEGRTADLHRVLGDARRIHERLGARVVAWRSVSGGGDPGGITYTLEFDDFAAYGRFADRLERDDPWREHLTAVEADGVARIMATSLLAEVEDV